MRVYLCGLDGVAEPSRELAFLKAGDELAALGHLVVSPYTSGLDCPELTLTQALDADRALLAHSEAIVILGEPGATCYETVWADMCGKPVIGLEQMARVAG